jgi:hypothetical protein
VGVVITTGGRCGPLGASGGGATLGVSGGGATVDCARGGVVTVTGRDGGVCTAVVVTVTCAVGDTVGTVVREIVGGSVVGVRDGPVGLGNGVVGVGNGVVGVGNAVVGVGNAVVGVGNAVVGVGNAVVGVGNAVVGVGNAVVGVGNGVVGPLVVARSGIDGVVVVVATITGTGKNVSGEDGFTGGGTPGGGGVAWGSR